MTTPIHYSDRIVIKRVKSVYLENIPYEILSSDIPRSEGFSNIYGGTLISGQLYDYSFYRDPWDEGRKLKIIAKTPKGIVESNTLVLPAAPQDQSFAFEIITKGNKQIYLVEVPFREEIIPLSRVTGVDKKGIIYNSENGEQKKILFSEAYEAWKECMGYRNTKPKYIGNCSEWFPSELRLFAQGLQAISFWDEEEHFERWEKLVKEMRSFGYDIFDAGRVDAEGYAKYIKEKIFGRKIEPRKVPGAELLEKVQDTPYESIF